MHKPSRRRGLCGRSRARRPRGRGRQPGRAQRLRRVREGEHHDVLTRNRSSGTLAQVPGKGGCHITGGVLGVSSGRGLADAVEVSREWDWALRLRRLPKTTSGDRRHLPQTGPLRPGQCTSAGSRSGSVSGKSLMRARQLAHQTAQQGGTNATHNAFSSVALGGGCFSSCASCRGRCQCPGRPGRPARGPRAAEGQARLRTQERSCRVYTRASGKSARGVAVSPDGRHTYVASSDSNAVSVFARNRRSGALRQPSGERGCVSFKGSGSCAFTRALGRPIAVAVSRDGRNVYVAAAGSDALAAFARNRRTGALRQLPGPAGCISHLPGGGCANGPGAERIPSKWSSAATASGSTWHHATIPVRCRYFCVEPAEASRSRLDRRAAPARTMPAAARSFADFVGPSTWR